MLLVGAAVFLAGAAVLAALAPPSLCLPNLLVVSPIIGFLVALICTRTYILPTLQPVPGVPNSYTAFEELNPDLKRTALDLACQSPPEPCVPIPPVLRNIRAKGVFGIALVAFVASIWFWPAQVWFIHLSQRDRAIASLETSGLWICLGALLYLIPFPLLMPKRVAAFRAALEKYNGQVNALLLRRAAVAWVNEHYEGWLAQASTEAIARGLERCGMPKVGVEAFCLYHPKAAQERGRNVLLAPDMPPSRVELLVLLVGDALGISSGIELLTRETAEANLQSAARGINVRDVNLWARSVHYFDIVKVEYSAGGTLSFAFVHEVAGERTFPGIQQRGVDSAVQQIASRREAAVSWVTEHYEEWLAQASAEAISRGLERFGMPVSKVQPFCLYRSHARLAPDMPPSRVDFVVLLAGDFLGIRAALAFMTRQTAIAQWGNSSGKVCVEDTNAEEKELHYADIVTVDYSREQKEADAAAEGVPACDGTFVLSLVDGQKVKYGTQERGAASAVEHIRRRTRSAKLRLGA